MSASDQNDKPKATDGQTQNDQLPDQVENPVVPRSKVNHATPREVIDSIGDNPELGGDEEFVRQNTTTVSSSEPTNVESTKKVCASLMVIAEIDSQLIASKG